MDESWYRRTNSNYTQFTQVIELYSGVLEKPPQPCQPIGQAAELKFESKFEPLPVIWVNDLTISPEGYSRDNRRFWQQNQWPRAWGSAPAQLSRTNTGRFRVGGSRCGPRPAWLSRSSATTLAILTQFEYKKVLMRCRYRAPTSHFFCCEMKFSMEMARSCRRPNRLPQSFDHLLVSG